MMSIVSPWILLALGALAIPVWVHLSRRNDEERQAFPSTMFINRLPVAAKSRNTLRDRVLFMLRCLALTLLVLAFATPFFPSSDQTSAESIVQDTVLMLDTSYSMDVGDRFESAVAALGSRINAAAGNTRIALVAFDQTPRTVVDLTSDHVTIKSALAKLATNDRATRLDLAFSEATRILQSSKATRKNVVLFSDVQRSALESSDSLRLPNDAVLEVERFDAPPGLNLAIANVVLETIENEGAAVTLTADVQNTGSESVSDVNIRFFADERLLATKSLSLEAGARSSVNARLVLSRDRPVPIRVEIDDDTIANDNVYHMVATRGRRLSVVIVEPERAHRHQSVFVREALGVGGLPGIDAVTETVDVFGKRKNLNDVDVIILNDVALPPGRARRFPDTFVNSGGGLMTVAGQNTRYISHPVENLQLNAVNKARARQMNSGDGRAIATARPDHATQLDTLVNFGTALSQVRIRQWRTISESEEKTTLVELDNGAPFVVEIRNGRGRHLVVTTTLDPRWSNFALEPGFVPAMHRFVDYLADRTETRAAFFTGDTINLARHGGAFADGSRWTSVLADGKAVVEDPDGDAHKIPADAAIYRPLEPGLYELHDPDGESIPIAVNTSREESLFSPADSDELRQRLVRTEIEPAAASLSSATPADSRYPLGWYLLLLAALFFIAENLLANRLALRRVAAR